VREGEELKDETDGVLAQKGALPIRQMRDVVPRVRPSALGTSIAAARWSKVDFRSAPSSDGELLPRVMEMRPVGLSAPSRWVAVVFGDGVEREDGRVNLHARGIVDI
jgi:hypothetical protein